MKRGFQIGTLFGIPFYLDPSWVVVAALMTLFYSFSFSGAGLVGGMLLGVLSVFVVFGSVLAHELGHSLLAKRFGVEVQSISLFLLGGMATFAKEPQKPWHSFAIAAAGPLTSLVLCFGFYRLLLSLPENSFLAGVVGLAWGVNLALASFNLLPGLPLDGGQMLKALVWGVTGDLNKGVKVAAVAGQLLGWGLVLLGGLLAIFAGNYTGFYLALLGWFIQSSARINDQAQRITQRLEHLTVADSLQLSGTVPANLPFSTYQQEYVKGDAGTQHLVEWQGEVIGVISAMDGTDLQPNLWGYHQVRQLMTPIDSELPSVEMNTSLAQVVEKLTQTPKLVVRGLEGNIVGVISPETIRRALATP
ncbi:site-2 protease family protein [Anthocerotibacter panamensis]|uniref:site-2 protease family protein n=1 Tax=Anthocerotibacter panamensis TaxID=2857077 RepID=UPI001C40262A|nr:site-2 protease family protein [Anthocerotibacter panamensis]